MASASEADDWGRPLPDPAGPPPPAPPPTEEDVRQRRRIRDVLDVYDFLAPDWIQVSGPPLAVYHRRDCGWETTGGRTMLPAEFMAVVTDPRYPLTVLDLSVEDGKVVCNRISFVRGPDDPPLRVAKTRVPVDGFRIEAAALAAARIEFTPDGSGRLVRSTGSADTFLAEYKPTVRERRRGQRLTDDELRDFASTYRDALPTGKPISEVMRKLYMSRSKAYRWVAEAQKRGFLDDPKQTSKKGDRDA